MEAQAQTTRSLRRAIVLVVTVAAVAVPAAQANHQYGDAVDRQAPANVGAQDQAATGGYLDAVDRFVLNNAPLDAVDRWLINHPPEGVASGALDAVEFIRSQPRAETAGRGYDAVELIRSQPKGTTTPTLVSVEPGFDWGDAGIGAGMAFGALLLAAAVAYAARSRGRVAHS